jgi:hypothetical protein
LNSGQLKSILEEYLPVAKTTMICPFSAMACKECGAYRGRHYFLCYCENYRGYIKPGKKSGRKDFWWRDPNLKLNVPLLNIQKSIDPFDDDHLEKNYNYLEKKEAT